MNEAPSVNAKNPDTNRVLPWSPVPTWPEVAAHVLKGAFDKSDKSTRDSIVIGLRSATDANSKEAVRRLESLK